MLSSVDDKLVIMLPSVDDKTGYNVTFMQQMAKLVLMLFRVDDKTGSNAIFSRCQNS